MKKENKIKLWAFGMRLVSRMGCHQIEDRCFKYKKWQSPLCSRCTGILTGQVLGFVLFLLGVKIALYIDLLFLAIMFLDWFVQYLKLLKSNNFRRFLTGNLAGIAQISILIKIVFIIVNFFNI